jgi:hypothetical protein
MAALAGSEQIDASPAGEAGDPIHRRIDAECAIALATTRSSRSGATITAAHDRIRPQASAQPPPAARLHAPRSSSRTKADGGCHAAACGHMQPRSLAPGAWLHLVQSSHAFPTTSATESAGATVMRQPTPGGQGSQILQEMVRTTRLAPDDAARTAPRVSGACGTTRRTERVRGNR